LSPFTVYPPALQAAHPNDLKAYRDNINVLKTARIVGESNKALEITRNMKLECSDPAIIAKMTGFVA